MPDETTGKTQTIQMQIEREANPEGRPMFYANNTMVLISQWDVQLAFSMIRETSPGKFASVDQALVIMTPEHALAVEKALRNALEGFESGQGKIRDVNPQITVETTKAKK